MHFTSPLVVLLAAAPSTLALTRKICSPTGPGTCTVAIQGSITTEVISNPPWTPLIHDWLDWEHSQVYDHNCNEISGDAKPVENKSLFSQLKWTIDFKRLVTGRFYYGDKDWNRWNFCYADKCYEGGAACEKHIEPGQKWEQNYCRRAFDC